MVYNNVTNALRLWCDEKAAAYYEEYEQNRGICGQSPAAVCHQMTAEMSYKLGAVVDRDFLSFETYKKTVMELFHRRIDFVPNRELSKVEHHYIRKVEQAFHEYLDSLSSDCPSPDGPYRRLIWGKEADEVAERFYETWEYDTNYWFPLNGMSGEDKLFIAPQYLEPYWGEIQQAIGLPDQHIYEYGEEWYDCIHCVEVDAIEDYSGCEVAYCPKDFSWIIYFSHENTVAFGGTILSRIKEILHCEREHWNTIQYMGEQ